ncbi:hypothetical protein [Streptomyces marincola]|uniref:hypothetical protein n=1 Tax=Streptomyces marincola TaxID=2878388 RepID=UPI001CF10982|nr:hypothetical protein [Streptomyces marincola]UCM90955.1 hypothetical protein LC193_25095 [Streptomyces marincola]
MTQPQPPAEDHGLSGALNAVPAPPPPPLDGVVRRARTLRRRRRAAVTATVAGTAAAAVAAVALVLPAVSDDRAHNPPAAPAEDGAEFIDIPRAAVMEVAAQEALVETLRANGIAAAYLDDRCGPLTAPLAPDAVEDAIDAEQPGESGEFRLYPDRVPEGHVLLVALDRAEHPVGFVPPEGIGGGVSVTGLRLAAGEPLPTCVPSPLPW